MRYDALAVAISIDPRCLYCRAPFKPRRGWQKFCSPAHRVAYHLANDDQGLRGIVRSVKRLKGGKVSITLHLDDIDAALRVEPGRVMEILDRDGAAIGGEMPINGVYVR